MKKMVLIKLMVLILFFSVLLTNTLGFYGKSLEEIQNEIKNNEKEKSSVQDKIGSLSDKKKEASNLVSAKEAELSEIEKAKQNNISEQEMIEKDIEHIYAIMLNMEEVIEETQEEYDKKEALFKERIKVMYQYSDYSIFQILIESKNILDFINRVHTMKTLLRNDMALMDEVELLKNELEVKKAMQELAFHDREIALQEKNDVLKQLALNQGNIEADYLASRKQLDAIRAEEDKLLKKSAEIEAELKRLNEESLKIKYEGGQMIWPAEKGTYISSYYGMRFHPIYKVDRMHTGIDIPAPGGSNILAANAGTVIKATWDSGYGNYIIVDHGGGISTLYAHASSLVAKVGDTVYKGQVIAKVGTTGTSTGNHLHFEVRVNGATVNPLNYVVVP